LPEKARTGYSDPGGASQRLRWLAKAANEGAAHPARIAEAQAFGDPLERGMARLDGAPFLLPTEDSASRRAVDQWLDARGIRPQIIGEFQDRALLSVFGQAGLGIFAAPIAIEKELRKYYQVALIGTLDSVVEEFYAISAERKIKHPAVAAISEAARQRLFPAKGGR